MPGRKELRFKAPPGAQERPCLACGATIIWILTPAQKRMPLSKASFRAEDETYVAHFVDCPEAASFRRPRRREDPDAGR